MIFDQSDRLIDLDRFPVRRLGGCTPVVAHKKFSTVTVESLFLRELAPGVSLERRQGVIEAKLPRAGRGVRPAGITRSEVLGPQSTQVPLSHLPRRIPGFLEKRADHHGGL